MITLSQDKIQSLLSLPGNNKCLECGDTSVEWVSFPTSIFICSPCGRQHKGFIKKPIVKSLSISEFTEKEISKLSIGGNDRFLSILKEYNIPLSEPNIENKYSTFASAYYNALLEAEIIKPNTKSSVKVLVIPFDESNINYCMDIASQLRKEGAVSEVYLEQKAFKKKMNYANRLGIPYVCIIGEDEQKSNKVTLKNMITGEQVLIDKDKVFESIK